ncbi:hypothetical protein [Cupriavidus sp. YAF13]|uniref:hypothetical protein n=1 Tax=Cupriavidus sp. YAF13 TaxID=3233075 RepID=UPI003F8DBF60
MMEVDYEIWNIDELLNAYVNTPDLAESVKVGMEQLFLFLENNGLLTCSVSDGHGLVVKRVLRKNDLTTEGKRLGSGPKNAVHRWLGSKGGQKNPPDMKMLEKALAEIRAEEG